LQALEKITRDQPLPCLQAGAIMAVLSFIDFFSTSVQVSEYHNVDQLVFTLSFFPFISFGIYLHFVLVCGSLNFNFLFGLHQRVALSTVVNICKKLPSENFSPFMEAVPILCNLLQYEDRQA
jgi:E3 ubiquitin-protein ligase TRIP12